MSEPAIELRSISRHFGAIQAVDRVSFTVQRGAIFGLLGPNGSGKSTIIRMLLGIMPATSGSATVLGFDSQTESEAIKPRIGYMSQQFSLYSDLSVRENIEFYGRIYGLSGSHLDSRRAAVIELTGIGDRMEQLAANLSGGWKQRLALACALIHEPEVIFLDEPTAGIDPVARRDLWDLLFKLSSQGVTLLVTTHYMDEAERCTDVGYLFMSRLLVLGKPEELKRLPSVTPTDCLRFDLKIPHPAEHLQSLRAWPDVRDATLFGERVHLLVDKSLTPDLILQRLSQPAGELSLQPSDPSLEDVFVTMTRAADKAYRSGGNETHSQETSAESIVGNDLFGRSPHRESAVHESTKREPLPDKSSSFSGIRAILIKEFFHIRRQPTTLFFMFLVPTIQTIIFGYAINTQIEHIPTVVWNMDGRRSSQVLIESFESTRRFAVVNVAFDQDTFDSSLQSGRARVGIIIPPNFSESLINGEQTSLQVLIDGSDSQVATTAQSSALLLGQNLSIELAKTKGEALQLAPARNSAGQAVLSVDVRTRILYNPDLDSSHFFVPGLVGIILQLVTLFLTSFAVVRERELGTLEQLFVTPVGRSGLMFGKLIPYACVGFAELVIMLVVMIYIFGVPIAGSIPLLLLLSFLFTTCSLGLGLLISTLAKTQLEAFQFAFIVMLPSILLSGFVFPRSEMPLPIYAVSFALPATYFIDILRGVILRGAGLAELTPSVIGLSVCCVVVLVVSIRRFRKRIA